MYDLSTGLFNGTSFTGSEEQLPGNTPAGCGAAKDVRDMLSQRVDTQNKVLVDYQPPAPSNSEMQTWAWNPIPRRWTAAPTLAARKTNALNAIDAAAGAARLRYITDVPGQQATYMLKADQAKAFIALNGLGAIPPFVQAEADATYTTPMRAAQTIAITAALWADQLAPAIEGARRKGKFLVDAANAAQLDGVTQDALSALAAI